LTRIEPEIWVQDAVGAVAGARELAPVHEEHGWSTGRMIDPFGHEWEIARQPEKT